MRALVLAATPFATIVFFAACGGGQGAVPVPTPAPTLDLGRMSAPSCGPDMKNPHRWADRSWTDDEIAEMLAYDCSGDTTGCLESLRESAAKSVDGITPDRPECLPLLGLACAAVPGQSCAPDECSQTDYECVPACNVTCTNCGVDCATKCEACKSSCKDEACRLACGKQCGACRQSCVKELDHCTTAHCAEVSEQCFAARDDEWNAATCEKVCPKVAACVEKCPPIENDYTGELYRSDCAQSCFARLGKGCPSRFDRICAGDPNASVNFNIFHENRRATAAEPASR